MNDPTASSFASLSRREALGLAAGLGVGAAMVGSAARGAVMPFKTEVDFNDPEWNRDIFARLNGNLDTSRDKCGWYGGKVLGVRPGEKVRELFGMEGFSTYRLIPREDGSYRKLLREVGFYYDLETGKVIDEWVNPYTGETVQTTHIANDPFNSTIDVVWPQPPSYGGLNEDMPPPRPFLLDWTISGDGKLMLATDIHLYYPSALQPDEWPRESPGPMSRVSEMFRYLIDMNEVTDPTRTSVTFNGTWNRITPWLPWMLMDQAEGHITYVCKMGGYDSHDHLRPEIRDYAMANGYEKYFTSPESDYGPSLSSLERYKDERTPAPPRAD